MDSDSGCDNGCVEVVEQGQDGIALGPTSKSDSGSASPHTNGQVSERAPSQHSAMPKTPEIRMRAFLAEAKILLESRPKWQLPLCPGIKETTRDGDREAYDVIPDWRRPSAGGARHGNGPWLLLDVEEPKQEEE